MLKTFARARARACAAGLELRRTHAEKQPRRAVNVHAWMQDLLPANRTLPGSDSTPGSTEGVVTMHSSEADHLPSSQASLTTVRKAVSDFMRSCGIKKWFGNPGSTELPMLRDFPEDFDYVLGLQEAVVVAMADGYAQATGNAAFVNLHSAAGVGNAMGNIYTAFKNQTPMVIVAGQQSRSIQLFDPYLNSKQVTELPKPYVKWAIEPARGEDVPQAIARAYYTAMQAPRGPVMVSVPADDWDAACHPVNKREVSGRVAADPVAIQQVIDLLARSRKPAILVGASIDRENAWAEVVELAERCSAAVYVAPLSPRCSFPEDHEFFQGFLPAVRAQIRQRLEGHDLVLVIGAPAFTYHVAGEGPHIPDGATLALLTEDPEVAAWAPEGLTVVGSILLSLKTVLSALPAEPDRQLPPMRLAPPEVDRQSLTVAYVLSSLSKLRNQEHAIVEEAPTARVVMHQYLPITKPRTFYTMASGGLGFGMPAAVGLALAGQHERVICIIGDGSTMYSPQALWTAAQKQLNVTFLVLNNQRYAALKRFAGVLNFPPDEKLVGIELPGLDFVSLAHAHGCAAQRVTDASQLPSMLEESLRSTGPRLLEIRVC